MGFFNENNVVNIALTQVWNIVIVNLLFILCSIPIVTIGPSLTALHHVTLRIVKGNNHSTARTFFKAFKENFRQSIIVWLISLLLLSFLFVNFQFLKTQPSMFGQALKFATLALIIVIIIINMYVYPVIAAFQGTLKQLVRNAFLFPFMHIVRTIIMLVVWGLPLYITYADLKMQPLYVFCWFFFLFAALALINSVMLYKSFKPYLPEDPADKVNDFYDDGETYLP